MRAGRESEPTESGVAAARRWRKIVAGEVAGESVADFEVVFVCTGNRFRSPLAAGLFTLATAGLPVTVRSAGTLDIGPRRAFPETLEEAHRFGLDLSRHSARAIAELETSAADLAVGFEQVHLAVRQGRPATLMPPFQGVLSEADIDAVVAYLQSAFASGRR